MDFPNLGVNAVIMRDAYKKYGSGVPILKGLNMMVQKGSIYGLLGPSGCDKTTLLNCIVGRIKLDSGSIKLIISEKRELGYMPQELGLYKELSIWQTFRYFGTLFEIPEEALKTKCEKLRHLLQLPSLKMELGQLSGGQQRRVSLAVVLLHDPHLLILDEPTAGLDPVLRANVWAQLLNLSNEGKTIIITTHYIEEANQAHCIGLMRHGVLLDNDSPKNLMMKHGCTSLENTFLKLSLNQQRSQDPNQNASQDLISAKPSKNDDGCSKPFHEDRAIFKAHRVKAQMLKQYYWMKRNIGMAIFMLSLPVSVIVIFNYTVGHPRRNAPIAIVNHEIGFSDCQNKSYNKECSIDFLSCRFIDEFNNYNVLLIEYESLKEAEKAIKKNRVWAALEFTDNFSGSLWERIQIGRRIDPMTEISSNIQVTMDNSDFIMIFTLNLNMRESYQKFMKKFLHSCNLSEKILDVPMSFNNPIYGSPIFNFTHFSMPAMFMLTVFYLPYIYTACAIVMEKREGLMERSIASGVTLAESLSCHMVVQTIMFLLQLTTIIFIQFQIFEFPTNSSLILPISLLFLQGVSGTFFGLTAGFLCDTEILVTLLGVGTMVPQIYICGVIWPIEAMHPILQAASIFFPLTIPVESLRAMVVKNWGITYFAVYNGFICTFSWMIGFILLSIIGLRFRDGLRPT